MVAVAIGGVRSTTCRTYGGRKELRSRTALRGSARARVCVASGSQEEATSVVRAHLKRIGGAKLLQATPEVNAAVETLIQAGAAGGLAAESLEKGAGVWEVFYMPHIRRIAEPLGLDFCPLRYTITPNGDILSDVQYAFPIVGKGWLSSSGVVRQKNENDIKLHFDSFWVGEKEEGVPRPNPIVGSSEEVTPIDNLINQVGKAAFLEDMATFPVLYFSPNAEICIFKFPPLNSAIAAYKVSSIGPFM